MQESNLTLREQQVMQLLSQGLLYKEIANELKITIDTVKKHCKNCYKKLNARNKVEAIKKYEGKAA